MVPQALQVDGIGNTPNVGEMRVAYPLVVRRSPMTIRNVRKPQGLILACDLIKANLSKPSFT